MTNEYRSRDEDLRIDLHIDPELFWEELASTTPMRPFEKEQSRKWRRRAVDGLRDSQLHVALREVFTDVACRHLLVVDEAGSGKTVTSLKIEHLLNDSKSRKSIFGDDLPRLVVYWSGRLPIIKRNSLVELIAQFIVGRLVSSMQGNRQQSLALADYALEENRVVIILDAFDELSKKQRNQIVQWFEETSLTVRWIITSREEAVKDQLQLGRFFNPNEFRRMRLGGFSEELQDKYIKLALGMRPREWRQWLQGTDVGWNALLSLPNTLREIVRFVSESKNRKPNWISPSDLFSQFSALMITRELRKENNFQSWSKLKSDVQDDSLSPEDALAMIEIVLGAVAMEMIARTEPHWVVVSAESLNDEVKSVWRGARERFQRLYVERNDDPGDIHKYWKWARNFASRIELHNGSIQGNLSSRWISFRNRIVQEMWLARFITNYASQTDLVNLVKCESSAVGHIGNIEWENIWKSAIRMPLKGTKNQDFGSDPNRYERAIRLLFQRPIQSMQRRPTKLMWEVDLWLRLTKQELLRCSLCDELSMQFLNCFVTPKTRSIAASLVIPENYVVLADPDAPIDQFDTAETEGQETSDKRQKIGRFAIAKNAVTNQQFRLFDDNTILTPDELERIYPMEDMVTRRLDYYKNDDGSYDEDRLQDEEDELVEIISSPSCLAWMFIEDLKPAVFINYYDAYWFTRFVSGMTFPATGDREWSMRLPKDCEFEYAFRAGCSGRYFRAKTKSNGCVDVNEESLGVYAHYGQYGLFPATEQINQKEPNAWGLHLCGNVFKWIERESTFKSETGLAFCRGGSWMRDARECCADYRGKTVLSERSNEIGFVLVAVLEADCP